MLNRKISPYSGKLRVRCSPGGNTLSEHKRLSLQRARSPQAQSDLFEAHRREVLTMASSIASMTAEEVNERYHCLVDEGLRRELTPLERFELERIETRLDIEDRDVNLEASDRDWELRRADLLESIVNLVGILKA
jgi:hypothetical protein